MMKIIFSLFLIFIGAGLIFPQSNQNQSYSSDSQNSSTGSSTQSQQGGLNIVNGEVPEMEFTEPFQPFKPYLPIRAWENWNENRHTVLQIVNPVVPRMFRIISQRPMRNFVFLTSGVANVNASVVNANSASMHHSVLQDDSANYGVEITRKFNFVLIFEGVAKPQDDFNAYAVIYIDRKKIGMTTKGLITQRKIFRTNLDPNKHLLKIKIVVQDEYRRSWTTLLNTQQPREKYFPVKKGFITVVKMTYRPNDRNEKYTFIGKFVKMSTIER